MPLKYRLEESRICLETKICHPAFIKTARREDKGVDRDPKKKKKLTVFDLQPFMTPNAQAVRCISP